MLGRHTVIKKEGSYTDFFNSLISPARFPQNKTHSRVAVPPRQTNIIYGFQRTLFKAMHLCVNDLCSFRDTCIK